MIKVNALGQNCPIPVVMAKKAMKEVTSKEDVVVLVDNEVAVSNVKKMAESFNLKVSSEKIKEKEYKVTIEMNGPIEINEDIQTCSVNNDNFVVVIGSDTMGSGSDELGKALMKGFIFAVSKLDVLPKTMLFYNGGVKLTTEGSDSLDDIKALEEEGVTILSCGTCLNYYELTDKLRAGSVTNMYTIAETMAGATRLLKP